MFAFIITFICLSAIVKHIYTILVDVCYFWLMCVCVCVCTDKKKNHELLWNQFFWEIFFHFSSRFFFGLHLFTAIWNKYSTIILKIDPVTFDFNKIQTAWDVRVVKFTFDPTAGVCACALTSNWVEIFIELMRCCYFEQIKLNC